MNPNYPRFIAANQIHDLTTDEEEEEIEDEVY